MEGSTVGGLRSRSRSKTPFLRSSCDHENCIETEDHTHAKSGRHTPVKRSTPVKQLQQTKTTTTVETITEEVDVSPPVTRSRQSARIAGDHLAKTSDYSSEESLDRLKGHKKEIFQNEVNSQYERVTTTTTSRHGTLADLTLSPIHAGNVTNDRSTRFGSPAYSACSSDSSFAEQALADASSLLDRDPRAEHLPSRLYKMAGEYWNKYPKTDYTYSPLSKDRVELAPGQIAVPNMSRRSLSQFRVQGPATSVDEVDRLAATAAWTANTLRKRYTTIDSSDDECYARNGFPPAQQRWWLTRVLITIVTSITSTVGGAYRSVVGPAHRYPYTERRPAQTGILSRTASVAAAPFYWIYTMIKTVVTTTITTVTETFSPSESSVRSKHASRNYQQASKRRWWPWLLLLLLPLLGYGSYYTYENADRFAMPNFTDFQLDLSEYSAAIPSISLPNITLPTLDLSLPDINITLPAITENLPEVSKTYVEYRDIVHNRVSDASDYVKVVAESCFEELRRFWRGHHYQEYILPQAPVTDTYKPPQIVQDPDLSKRVAALEDWAINVDSRIKFFDQKLSKFDNLEEQIEQYSVRYLQQNLIQIFNAQDSDAVAAKLKSYFDEHYISKEQMLVMSQEIHERLIASWQPELDEDKIRGIVQGYLSVFEKKQMEVLVARFKEYVKEVEVTRQTGAPDMEAVRRLVAGMLDVYDADKTGLVDYALESAGGQVVSTKCTELYQIKTKQYSILGLPVWWVYTSPRFALTPGAMPAECWAFQGFPGYLVIRTYAVVEVTGFSLEHMSRLLAVDGKIESAPKNFSVYGLHGESDPEPHLFGDYTYDANGTAIQHFPVQHPKTTDIGGVAYPVAYDIVELRVESNHGNPTYTCVYRFRVHGNPLTDIRRATEDSIRDSET